MAGLSPVTLGLLVVSCAALVVQDRRAWADKPQPGLLNITEAFRKSGTDKMSMHGYHRFYEQALAPYKDLEDLALLEIGAYQGASLMAWVEYFSRPSRVDAVAYKADPVEAKAKACEAGMILCEVVTIYNVDQSDPKQLENMVKAVNEAAPQHPGWDLIIDDGSHIPMHQLTTFKHLFPTLRPGGLYILEDVETSYMAGNSTIYGYPLSAGIEAPPGVSAVNKFLELVHVVNRKHFLAPDLTAFGKEVDSTVAKVSFVDNAIFIEKQPADATWNDYPKHVWANTKNEQTKKATQDAVHEFEAHVAKELPIP